MSEHETLENRELVKKIISLCQQRASGTVFIVTEDNHLARIVLIKGEIVCASLQRLEGVAVIRALSNMASGAFGFNPELQVVTKKQALPDTASLLETLQSGDIYLKQRAAVESAPLGAKLPSTPEILNVLVQESTEFLGPMASILCQEYIQDLTAPVSEGNIQHVIRQLERDINHPDKVDKFSTAVRKRLGL